MLQDAYLPLRLIDKLMIVVNLVEMARVTGVTINQLMTRGQQIKVPSLARRLSHPAVCCPRPHDDVFSGGHLFFPHSKNSVIGVGPCEWGVTWELIPGLIAGRYWNA